jgi:hypothetical protein
MVALAPIHTSSLITTGLVLMYGVGGVGIVVVERTHHNPLS